MAGDLNSPTSRMTLPCVPNYSESLKLPNCMLGLPIGFTWGLNHTSKGTVTFPLRAPHGEYPKNSPWGHIRAVSVRCPCEWLDTGAFYPSALWAGGVLSSRSGRAGAPHMGLPMAKNLSNQAAPGPNLWNLYLWNHWMDLYHSKCYGIVSTCSCATASPIYLDPRFSRSNFENAVSQEWEDRSTQNERDMSR